VPTGDDVWVSDRRLVPLAGRANPENRSCFLYPTQSVSRARQTDAGLIPRSGLIPIHQLVSVSQGRAIGGDVVAFPTVRIWFQYGSLRSIPSHSVSRSRDTTPPNASIETRVDVQQLASEPHDRRIQNIDRIPAPGRSRADDGGFADGPAPGRGDLKTRSLTRCNRETGLLWQVLLSTTRCRETQDHDVARAEQGD